MADISNKQDGLARGLKWLVLVIMIAGALIRLLVYLQNRDLIIDEANVARNIFERGFLGLALPLNYEQYAPPVFLWLVKLSSVVLGFSEPALRLYTFLMSLGSLYFFYKVLRRLTGLRTLWYPMFLFACSPILIRYSSELKQYMPDVCISLVLIHLALSMDIRKMAPRKFLLQWLVIGSLAIWASMPSVFLLAGVGCYYGIAALQEKDYKRLRTVVFTSFLWVLQFAIYYVVILMPQIGSDYLQEFHQHDFLFLTPETLQERLHNWAVVNRMMRQFSDTSFFVNFTTILIFIGSFGLLEKNTPRVFLLVLPLGAVLLAAGFNQFSLLPRVALFTLPLILLITAVGYHYLMVSRFLLVRAVALMAGLYGAVLASQRLYQHGQPFRYEELTEGFTYARSQGLSGPYLYLHHASGAAFLYYTQIHPDNEKWDDFKTASVLPWYTNYDSLAWQMRYVWKNEKPVGMMYTNVSQEELDIRTGNLLAWFKEVKRIEKPYLRVYLYDPKPDK